jgi:TonB family protein
MTAMPSRSTRSRFLVAAGLALGLHLLLAVLVLRWPHPSAPPKAPARHTMAVELRTGPAPSAQPAPAPGPTEPAKPTGTTKTGSQVVRAPRASPSAGPKPAEGGDLQARGPEWLSAEGLVGTPQERGPLGVTTTLRDPLAALGPGGPKWGAEPGPVREPTEEEKLVEEKARVEHRLRVWNEDFQARERARDVRDAYWQKVEDALAKGFKVDWDILDRARARPNSSVGKALEGWQRAAAAYGGSGSPYGDQPPAKEPLNAEVRNLQPQDRGFRGTALETPEAIASLQFLAESALGPDSPFHKRLVVLVRVLQREDGSLERAEIAGSSGNRSYDQAALDRARALAGDFGPPPPQRRQTLWAFETDFSQFPPFPIVGCALDAAFVPRECVYPFKKTVVSRIKLQAVY